MGRPVIASVGTTDKCSTAGSTAVATIVSCAIANVGVEGLPPAGLATALLEDFGIYTVAIDGAGVQGCRITPNVFNTPEEMAHLVAAVSEIARRAR